MKNCLIKYLGLAFILFSLCSYGARAQNSLSLNDAIKIALENNPDYAIKKLQVKENEQILKREIADKLPDITLQAGSQRNFIIGATPIPAKIMYPTADENEIYPAKFGTDYSGVAGLSFQYDIFNPDNHGSVSTQKVKKSISQANSIIAKENLITNIELDYAAVLIAIEQWELCKIDTLQSSQSLSYVNERFELGQASKEELLKAKQDLNIAKTRLVQAENVLDKSKITLFSDMGKDLNYNLINSCILTDNLESLEKRVNTQENLGKGREKDELELKLKELDNNNSKLKMLPTLSLTGYYGSNYYYDKFRPFNTDKWYGNAYLGIKLTYPLTKLFGKAHNMKNARLEYNEAKIKLRENEISRTNEVLSYSKDIDTYKVEMGLRKENLDYAEERFEAMTAKFDEGQIYPAQLTEALHSLRESRTDYLNSLYNYFVASAKKKIAEVK